MFQPILTAELRYGMPRPSKISDWLRAGALILVVLGAAFVLYGRLVRVETKLATPEARVGKIHDKLFPTGVAER